MEDTKKKKKKNINNEDSKKKERHIVTWAPEVCDEYIYTYMSVLNLSVFWNGFLELQEDVILRDQITLHGTEKWEFLFYSLDSSVFFPEKVLVFKKRDSKKECWVVVIVFFCFFFL